MNEHDPSDDLSPDHAEVRRLLADARHDEPMPDDVAQRLDRVLAGLAEEPVRAAPVARLATRRRRAAGLLLAAAAAVAIGIGVGQVVDPGSDNAESLATADRDESGAGQAAAEESGEAEAAPEDGAEAPGVPTGGAVTGDRQDAKTFAELTRREYADQVAELRAQDSTDGLDKAGLSALSATGETCRADTWGSGTFVPVRYEGVPAVVVLRRARGDTQVADLFFCGDSEPVRSVTLPAP